MKIAVIGGGSTYTPELVNGFLDRVGKLPVTELWLMDIDPQRLEIVGGFAQRMVAAKGSPFQVVLTTDQRAAVKGASYVTTQMRVGQMKARVADEYLGRRHNLIGQETTGVGGMAKAMRTIPVLLRLAADMHELAPGAVLVNFTNPSGLVTEALARRRALGGAAAPATATSAQLLPLGPEFQAVPGRWVGARLGAGAGISFRKIIICSEERHVQSVRAPAPTPAPTAPPPTAAPAATMHNDGRQPIALRSSRH